ncbi:MAG: tRNA (adenosine(37)-N6)-threonylcarbamoyltransferase complex ATPase subunit type 1 TsaE [Thermoleophilia bacterium]|nr:tRNA (adenosine(37)-N6)-threonylcarbamoyltransferase complex ATPase subunit type 1 TsaE [Thermoleophilia bacterium]
MDLAELGRVAGRLARALRPGELVLLYGPLGAGKTTFVREVARSLGVRDTVRSPSFTIANVYAGAECRINHLDLYRLEEIADEDVVALEEYVEPAAVTLVEWPESGLERLGRPQWTVLLEHDSVRTRRLTLRAEGAEQAARWRAAAEPDA